MQKIIIDNKPTRRYNFISYLVTKMPRLATYRSAKAVSKYLQKLQKCGKNIENFGKSCKFCVKLSVKTVCGLKSYVLNCSGKNTIIYLHGGAFVNRPTKHHMNFACDIAKLTDSKVLVPYYPLAPFGYVKDATSVLTQIVAEQNGKVVLLGDSAGGGLVFSLMYALEQAGMQDRVICCVALSPWLDMSLERGEDKVHDRMLSKAAVGQIAKYWCGELDDEDPLASPARAVFKTRINALIIVGGREALKVDAGELLDANSKQNITYVEYTSMEHDFALYPVPERKECLGRMANYINTYINKAKQEI